MVSQENSKIVPITSIPADLRENIQRVMLLFAVSLFRAESEFSLGREEYIGSGTFVLARGRRCVLTAAHVWKVIQQQRMTCILLGKDGQAFCTPTDAVEPLLLTTPESDDWGPDLALLALPDEVMALAKNLKIFYNLERRTAAALGSPCDTKFGLWAVTGGPAEFISHTRTHSILTVNSYFSGIDTSCERGEFDYYDLGLIHKERPDLPRSYGGVSGAGLWQVPLAQSESTGDIEWDGTVSLEGVAFYEQFNPDGRGFIRCHGRRSIYGAMRRLVG